MWWHGHLDEVNADLKQPIVREGDLPARLRPYNLTLGSKGEPWVMINFHADYEEEHGVGVLTNGTRVLGIGYSTDVTPYKR